MPSEQAEVWKTMRVSIGLSRGHRDGLLVLGLSLVATAPVWVPTYPPMVDLPQHASQIALLKNLQDPSFEFAGLFEVNWFTPYLLGYMLVYAAASVVGIVVACKVVIALALAGLPVATALVMTETGTDRRWALLTVPALYGFSYQWGFLNFIVAAPVGMVLLWLAMRHAREPSVGTSVWMAITSSALFFCHALTCVFFSLVAACYIAFEAGNVRTAARRVAPLVAAVPPMAAWGIRTLVRPTVRMPVVWDLGLDRVTGLVPRLLGVSSDFVLMVFGLTIICLPWFADARLNRRRATWIPFLACIATVLLVPHGVLGFTFTHHRLAVFALPLYLIALTDSPSTARRGWLRLAIPLAVTAWTAVVGAHALKYQADVKGFDQVMQRMGPRQRVLSLMFLQESRGSSAPTFQHFPSWYAAQKSGVVDPSFAVMYIALVHYRQERLPQAGKIFGLSVKPEQFNWWTFGGENYRYFVVRAPADLGPYLFRRVPCRVSLICHSNSWWLYEKDADCPSASGPEVQSQCCAADRPFGPPDERVIWLAQAE